VTEIGRRRTRCGARQCDGAEQDGGEVQAEEHAERHKRWRPASGRTRRLPSTGAFATPPRTVRKAPTCPEGASLEIRLATLVSQAGLEGVEFYGPLALNFELSLTVADV